ncbi:MAG: ABC transporter permease, partial [Clostridia bacterium]|nr:ABC transporter permease [Clostridia bacterium]
MRKKNDAPSTGRKNISKGRDILNRLLRNKNAVIGLFLVAILVFFAIFADVLVDYENDVIRPDVANRLKPPSAEHWLGTDELGRDVLSRIIYASRMSLLIGVLSVCFAMGIGIVLGSVAGFYGGWVEMVIMRVCEIFEGIPNFLLAITLTAAFGTSLFNLMLAIGLGTFAGQAKIIRGAVLTIKGNEYIEAGKAMGASNWQIIRYHVLPNCVAVLIVQFSLRVASGVLAASSLSFLGLGVQPPDPEWGAMLSGGRDYLLNSSYLTLFPGLCIMITILAFNMVGDGLR